MTVDFTKYNKDKKSRKELKEIREYKLCNDFIREQEELLKSFIATYGTREDIERYSSQKKEWEKKARKFIKRTKIKKKIIFHGGCLNCLTPLEKGLRVCVKCCYFKANWKKKDLSFK